MEPDLSDAVTGARSLLGWELLHQTPAGPVGGIILETEAYDQTDPASHSYRGPTARNAPMFGQAGTIYLYLIYGMYWCLNIATGPAGSGQAVLIRSLRPTRGLELMRRHRPGVPDTRLTHGPGVLTIALAIPLTYNGRHISGSPLALSAPATRPLIGSSGRVGIRKAADTQWRFFIR